jgi:predicted AAA+ superfamily ATPase
MYKERTLKKAIKRASSFFPVVLITGPRQVGKTTVFENCESKGRNYITLDTFEMQEMAKNDPQRFLEKYRMPLLEVDIILEENGKLYPLEIKQKTNPNESDIKNFTALSKFKKEIAPGGVLCLSSSWQLLGKSDYTIPITYI